MRDRGSALVKVPLWAALAAVGVIAGASILTRSLPYGLVVPVVVGLLTAEFACSPDATPNAKRAVVLVTVWTLALAASAPVLSVSALVVLIGVGVFLALYREVISTR